MEFHERLKNEIKNKKTNGTSLAREIKVSKSAMSGYLKGANYPTVPVLKKISEYLNISIDYLIKGETYERELNDKELEIVKIFNKLNDKNKLMAIEEIKHLARIQNIENM